MPSIKSAVFAVFLSLVFVLVHAEFKLPVSSIVLGTRATSLNIGNTIHKQLFINNNVSEGGPKNIYIDGRKGLDSNSGLTIESPVKTVQRLLSLEVSPFDIINVARGSEFREELNLGGVSNLTLKDYGTGPKPVFDCADVIANDLFSVAPEHPGVYKINFTNEYIDYSQYSVWENNMRLVRATSISHCSRIPGSYYAPVPTPGSSDIIYIHASDNSSLLNNGKKYEIARRGYGIFLGNGCKAYNMHTRRNGANNGSFLSGQDSYLKGITAEDGVKHNLFMESGMAEECIAWKADDPLVYGGATMFISYSHTGGNGALTVSYKNCIVLAGMNGAAEYQPGMIGIYAHSSGLPYKNLSIDGGVFSRVNAAISGEVDTIDIRNSNFYKCVYAVSKEGGTVRFENNIITQMPGRDAPISANISSLSCNNNKFNLLPGCVTIQGNIINLQANNNTVYSAGFNSTFVYSLAGANSKVELKNNLFFNDTAKLAGISVLYQKDNFKSFPATINSSNNHGVDIRYQLDYIAHNLVSIESWGKGYEAGSANDLGSTRFTGDYTSGDFFLSRLHPLYKSAGSENTFNQVSRYGIPFFYLSAGSWRWRNDNGSESQATWKGDQRKPVFINTVDETFRLRVEVFNDWFEIDANDSLQYSTSVEGPWLTIGENEAGRAFVLGKTSLNVIDQEHTTAQLTSDSKYTFIPGLIKQNSRTKKGVTLTPDTRTEVEWIIKSTTSIQPNTNYYFREHGTTKNYESQFASLTTGTAFPAELSYFKLNQENKKVKIEWESSELFNAYFEIFRSSDGAIWEKIAIVQGNGRVNTSRRYFTYDNRPLSGINQYFIKLYDTSGQVTFTVTKSLRMEEGNTNISVYPNPSSSVITFKILNKSFITLDAVLSDLNGRVIYREIFNNIGNNAVNALNLPRKPAPGLYILTVNGKDLSESLPVLIK